MIYVLYIISISHTHDHDVVDGYGLHWKNLFLEVSNEQEIVCLEEG